MEDTQKIRELWLSRAQKIKVRFSLQTDKELSKFLDVSQQALQQFMAGDTVLPSLETRFQMLNLLGMSAITDSMWELLPTSKKVKFKAAHDELTKRLRLKENKIGKKKSTKIEVIREKVSTKSEFDF